MLTLQHPYPSVAGSFGGSQSWLPKTGLQQWGCGLIAATDLLLYLHQSRPELERPRFCDVSEDGTLNFAQYHNFLSGLNLRYFPVLPPLGMNGWMLCGGLNRYFRKYDIPLHASWGRLGSQIWPCMKDILNRDLPVILGVGKNFPNVLGRQSLSLYTIGDNGNRRKVSAIRGHFVTVTGMDGRWLQLSSWGAQYYMDREEFSRYLKDHSSGMLTNIVCLSPKEGIES